MVRGRIIFPRRPKKGNFLQGNVLSHKGHNSGGLFFTPMKIRATLAICVIFVAASVICHAEQATASLTVVGRTANTEIWATGSTTPAQTNQDTRHLTKIATGLNYWDGSQWRLSNPTLQVSANGQYVYANQLQTKVQLSANLASSNSVCITTPDGVVLSSAPIAIGLFDAVSGDSMILGSITNCSGTLISSNQVLYTNCFTGICADILYTVQRGSFSQDIIWKQNIDPATYNFPTNSTRIQIFTALTGPAPEQITRPLYVETNRTKRSQMASPDFIDHTLHFGQLRFGPGRAFSTTATNRFGGASIAKDFQTISGQSYLIESVRYNDIRAELQSLPRVAALAKPKNQSRDRKEADNLSPMPIERGLKNLAIPLPHSTIKGTFAIKARNNTLADAYQPKGVIADYIALPATEPDPMVFQSDETYFVDGPADFDNVVLEGGSCIKYPNDTAAYIEVDGNITCETQPYLPCVFVSADDDSVGQSMNGVWGGYSGTIQPGGYANPALQISGGPLDNLRISDAVTGIHSENDITVTNLQVINCGYAFYTDTEDNSFYENVLVANANCAFGGFDTYQATAENVTIANCGVLLDDYEDDGFVVSFYNSILANIAEMGYFGDDGGVGNNNGFYNNAFSDFGSSAIDDGSSPFQTVGGGDYYLADSTFRGQGTTNIDPALLAGLATETTYPPIVYDATNISGIGTLSPQAQRDTNSCPDLGYHYFSLDYAFGGCDLHDDLTFTPGTSVGWFEDNGGDSGQPYSISLNLGAKLSFEGNATQPNIYARYVMVQEAENGNWTGDGWVGGLEFDQGSLSADFTRFTSDFWNGNTFRDYIGGGEGEFQNCEFYNLLDSTYSMSLLDFTNCLFFRSLQTYWYSPNLTFENCTFYNGMLFLGRPNPVNWLIQNCSFDGTALTADDDYDEPQYNTIGYNAYNTNNFNWQTYPIYGPYTNTLEVVGPKDLMVSNFNWQVSSLGNFYVPPGSLLITNGSTNANFLGLYHFTTQTDQTPDGTNIVTIGYHYVSVNTDGNPLDSNGDGIPDYLEDANGDGLADDGETNWALAILVQPTTQTAVEGTSPTLSVTAGGVPSLIYQWYFDSNILSGAISATLAISDIQTNNAGKYFVVVTNSFGAVTSSIATLTVLAPPTISITNPANNSVFIANRTNLTLMAAASDFDGTVTQVQFFEGTVSLGSVTNPPYSVAWSNAPSGYYTLRAVAIDNYGLSSTSAAINLTITFPAQVAIGGERIMELTGNGDVISWGGNQYGEFGDDTYLNGDAALLQSDVPVHVVGLTNIVEIVSGMNHSLALDSRGLLWTWGQDDAYQLGNGDNDDSTNVPEEVIGVTNVIAIAASGYFDTDGLFGFSLAAETNGMVWVWGSDDGDFGNPIPTQITDVSNAVNVAAANTYAVILEKSGSVWIWDGGNSSRISGLSNIVAICGGGFNYMALDTNGIVWTNGPNRVGGISNVVAIATSGESFSTQHYLALDKGGQLWAWGDDGEGQLGDNGALGSTNRPTPVEEMTNIISIAAGSDASVAVDGNYRLWQFGSSEDYTDFNEEIWSWGNTNGLPIFSPQYADFYNGQLPNLLITNGNNQMPHAGLEFPQPLAFKVTDANGASLSNAPISVQVIAGDMTLRTTSGGTNYQGLRLTTDVNGIVSLIGYADRYANNTNCLVKVLAASRQQLAEQDFTQTLVTLPTVSITSPLTANAYLVSSNQTLTITVNAQAGPGGTISAVDYYYGTNGCANIPLGVSTQCPFSFTWTNSLWWSNAFYSPYTVSAIAVDNAGATSDPQSVTFFVALDSGGEGLPDYWQFEYFGTNGLDPNSSPDGNGQSLLYDFQNQINPTDYYSGNVPTLTVLGGNDQSGIYNAFLPLPLVVAVTDSSGNVLTNAPLTLDVTNGTALLAMTTTNTPTSALSLRTDSNGLASAWIYFPAANSNPPDSAILICACSTTNCVSVIASEFVPLAHWTFNDTNTWAGAEGQLPLVATNVVGVPDWSSNAVQIDSVNTGLMSYHVIETNGRTNINCQVGSILFWFKPDWSSVSAGGAGPGNWGRLIEMGHYNPAFTNGWWSLYLSADGNQLLFSTSTNGSGTTNLTATVSWDSNDWYQVALTYAPTGSMLYVNGQLLAIGSGITCFPNADELTNGFSIGSDLSGNDQAAGTFDELQTFNYPLSADETATFDGALPIWWELEYFNAAQLDPLATYGYSQDLLYDYTRTIEPNNAVGFVMANTSRYFNSASIAIPLLVTNGIPYFEAVLVNDTNTEYGDFSNAVWQPYTSSNITVNLDAGETSYNVWIGLRGWPANAGQTWVGTEVWLRTNAPVITITKPSGSTVTQPIIQLQGLVSETLSKLTYDISNAQGVITNQPGQWTALFFDTNVSDFTTNFFQCYDVPLTNGVNSITVHAMDSAGNCSTTNVSFTLDYSAAVPPSLALLWPSNGMCISGTNFTVQGQLDDDTATVTAQVVDSSGNTNTVQGLVERSGLVWAQNLPLALGTNILTITATNAAGLSTTTNLTLMQSRVLVTINPLTQFNQAAVSVTGTISDPTCSLTVNGTNAYYLDTNGDWEADDVPVSPTGTATFNVQVFTADPTKLGEQTASQVQPATLETESYLAKSSTLETFQQFGFGAFSRQNTYNWNYTSGGDSSSLTELSTFFLLYGENRQGVGFTNPFTISAIPSGIGAFNGNWEDDSYANAYNTLVDGLYPYFAGTSTTANGRPMVAPSGQAAIGQMALYLVQALVSGVYPSPTPPISSSQIRGQTLVPDSPGSPWGDVLLVAPAGEILDTKPIGAPGNISYPENLIVPTLQIIDNNNNGNIISGQTNFVIVGQQMNLSCQLSVTNPVLMNSMLTNFQWTVPGYAISNFIYNADSGIVYSNFPTTNSAAVFYWVDGATNRVLQCSARIGGVTISGQAVFNVLRPRATISAATTSVNVNDSTTYIALIFDTLTTDGITFSNSIIVPPGFSGSNLWIQVSFFKVRQLQDTNLTWHVQTESGMPPYGDAPIPYQTFFDGNPVDAPGMRLPLGPGYLQGFAGNNFGMWMMFQPSNGIPVPLRIVNWFWSGTATNGSGGWTLLTGTNSVNPSDSDTETFPTWNSNIRNHQWIPPL
jgi:alpha-tubulin suppressor-like RCC1 family protein